MQEEDYLIYKELPKNINFKAQNLPHPNYRETKDIVQDDFTATKILFTITAVILSSMTLFMTLYLAPLLYHAWRFITYF